jgi:hypothetical protein
MNIYIYASASCLDLARRVISLPVDNANKNLAEIRAIELALFSVKKRHRMGSSVSLFLTEGIRQYLQRNDKGKYRKNSKKYATELKRIRKAATAYSNLEVMDYIDEDNYSKCELEAKKCAKTQKPKDTRTQKA